MKQAPAAVPFCLPERARRSRVMRQFVRAIRMFAASQYLQAAQGASSMTFVVLEVFLLVIALAITLKACSSNTT